MPIPGLTDGLVPFYTRKLGTAVTLKCFIIKGRLVGEINNKQCIFKGIPYERFNNLNDPAQQQRLRELLDPDQSTITHNGIEVNVMPQALGGWGAKQHRGYFFIGPHSLD